MALLARNRGHRRNSGAGTEGNPPPASPGGSVSHRSVDILDDEAEKDSNLTGLRFNGAFHTQVREDEFDAVWMTLMADSGPEDPMNQVTFTPFGNEEEGEDGEY
mmetsp:Transcript_1683/g.1852  ORF Transcript_1683/g.1852 Transcript_1683/m.1852 type:complete len:104 (-) Transcript_1683:168-479(-)